MESVANARKDGKCWRYKKNWQSLGLDGAALDEAFSAQVLRFSEDIVECPMLSGKTKVWRGDARRELRRVGGSDSVYDGLLTSPPYLNSFDYTDIYRPELFLLNAARNSSELRKLRLNTVRSHVQVSWKPSAKLDIPVLQKKINEIDTDQLWCNRIPEMINAYFVDLDSIVHSSSVKLKRGGTAAFVVADSAYNGVVFPVEEILIEILERRGFVAKETKLFRQTLGNGHHQQRDGKRLREVMIVAKLGH